MKIIKRGTITTKTIIVIEGDDAAANLTCELSEESGAETFLSKTISAIVLSKYFCVSKMNSILLCVRKGSCDCVTR